MSGFSLILVVGWPVAGGLVRIAEWRPNAPTGSTHHDTVAEGEAAIARRLDDAMASGVRVLIGVDGGADFAGLPVVRGLQRRYGARLGLWPATAEGAIVLAPVRAAIMSVFPVLGEAREDLQLRSLAAALGRMAEGGALNPLLSAGGDVLGAGAEDTLREAAAPSPGDCYALPAGSVWTPVDTALGALRASLGPVAAVEEVTLSQAAGRYLAHEVRAVRANPPAANSAVDGYAFRHADIPQTAPAAGLAPGRSAAGTPHAGVLPKGAALRILTGALIPEGADTVLLQEDATVDGDTLRMRALPRRGANIRAAGEDVEAGEAILPAGHLLRPQDLALIAAVGVGPVQVRRRLRVGVLSTGDELAEAGEQAAPERIYDANRPMLMSVLGRWGYDAVDLGRAPDDRWALQAALDDAGGRVDAVLTSGGASGGDEDHVSALLAEAGDLITWRVAMKPGRPLVLGRWAGAQVFGLPGNPVAALVTTVIFARPALGVMAGGAWAEAAAWQMPAAFAKRKKAGRREYLRARLNPAGEVEVFASEGSGRISGLSWADGLVELPDEAANIAPGDPVRYLPWSAFGL